MKVSAIQFNVTDDKAANIATIENLVGACVERDAPDFVVLPEASAFLSADVAHLHALAEPIDGPYAQAMAGLAVRNNCVIHAGSIVERRGDRFYNTSQVFDRSGDLIGRYSKIHRFDVVLPDGTEMRESDIVDRGDEIVVIEVDGHKVGLSICYDLRFSQLFHQLALRGASIIVLPAAFTFQTGADHWEVLVRARAIETQCYVVAPNQIGTYGNGKYMNFAHSMIVDPWGMIIGQASNSEGWITATLDMGYLASVRSRLPVHQHHVLR